MDNIYPTWWPPNLNVPSTTATATTSTSKALTSEPWFWVVIGVSALAALLLGGFVIWLMISHIRRRRHGEREHYKMVEQNVVEAEKQRLQTIMQYLSLKQQQQQGMGAGGRRPSAVWAFQAQGNEADRCVHGNFLVPPGMQGVSRAFVNVCPICAPQAVLGNNGVLAPSIGQAFGGDMGQTIGRIRPAQHQGEYPTVPPPLPPPGYVAVPMVLETA